MITAAGGAPLQRRRGGVGGSFLFVQHPAGRSGGAKWRGEVVDGAPETPDGAPEMMATGPLFATTIAVWQDVYTKTKSTSVPHIRRGLVFNTRAPGPSLAAGWSLAGAGTWLNF